MTHSSKDLYPISDCGFRDGEPGLVEMGLLDSYDLCELKLLVSFLYPTIKVLLRL